MYLSLGWSRLQLVRVDDPDMDLPFSEDEIHHAVRQMPSEKAPGPDGFTGIFYKACFQLPECLRQRAFHSGQLHVC